MLKAGDKVQYRFERGQIFLNGQNWGGKVTEVVHLGRYAVWHKATGAAWAGLYLPRETVSAMLVLLEIERTPAQAVELAKRQGGHAPLWFWGQATLIESAATLNRAGYSEKFRILTDRALVLNAAPPSPMRCTRCLGRPPEVSSLTVSAFNTDWICDICAVDERSLPGYKKARQSELESVQRGERFYQGIGLTVTDLARLEELRLARPPA